MSTFHWRAALALAAAGAASLSAGSAGAETALERCWRGAPPDVSETTTHWGNQPAASFPAGDNPDNAIFPGDVVRVTVCYR